jgi:putative ABC transport system ATP-binding protein
VLSVKGVVKRFGARTVLNYVSFDLAAGEYVAVIGESGIGKSTLLNVIAGLEPIDAGQVWFEGQDLAVLDDDARTLLRRDHFGFVFQAFHVLPQLNVGQNVGLPLLLRGIESSAKVGAALAAVGLGALGRGAAARRHRPGAGRRAEARAGGRAHRQSRPGECTSGARAPPD